MLNPDHMWFVMLTHLTTSYSVKASTSALNVSATICQGGRSECPRPQCSQELCGDVADPKVPLYECPGYGAGDTKTRKLRASVSQWPGGAAVVERGSRLKPASRTAMRSMASLAALPGPSKLSAMIANASVSPSRVRT